MRVQQRRQGRPGARRPRVAQLSRRGGRAHRRPMSPPRCRPRARRSPRRPASRGSSPPGSRPRTSRGCRSRRGCADRGGRRRCPGSGRPRAAGGGTRGVELVGEDVRPEPREEVVEAGARIGHELEHRVRRTGPPRARACGSRARPAAGSAASAGRGDTPPGPPMRRCEWSVRSPSKRRNRCLPWASTERTPRPCRRSGQRSSMCGAAASRSSRSASRRERRRRAARRSGSCRPRA